MHRKHRGKLYTAYHAFLGVVVPITEMCLNDQYKNS